MTSLSLSLSLSLYIYIYILHHSILQTLSFVLLQITFYNQGNRTIIHRDIVVDVPSQRERAELMPGEVALAFFNKNISYVLNGHGRRTDCVYFTILGTLNNSVVFPNVISIAIDQKIVDIDGVPCRKAYGNACLELSGTPFDPTKVICAACARRTPLLMNANLFSSSLILDLLLQSYFCLLIFFASTCPLMLFFSFPLSPNPPPSHHVFFLLHHRAIPPMCAATTLTFPAPIRACLCVSISPILQSPRW